MHVGRVVNGFVGKGVGDVEEMIGIGEEEEVVEGEVVGVNAEGKIGCVDIVDPVTTMVGSKVGEALGTPTGSDDDENEGE